MSAHPDDQATRPVFDKRAILQQHPLFGALKGLMRVVPGTGLTEPADPEWGETA